MDYVISKLLGFAMVLTRTSVFFITGPVFSWQSIPSTVKIAMTVLVSIFFCMVCPVGIDANRVSTVEAVLYLCNEALYGLALGLVAILIFSAVKFAGQIVEREMGLAMAEILDPMTGEMAQPLGMFLEMVFILLLLSANGHHLLLLVLSRSYEAFPAGRIPTISALANAVLEAGATLLMAGLRLAAPILGAFLLLNVVLAVLARVAQEMNILLISLSMRVALGFLVVVVLFIPFLNGFVGEFAEWMGKLLPL